MLEGAARMPLNGSANMLKASLAEGRVQIGFWSSLCSPLVVELIAGAGFDWLLVDSEHAPNDLPQVVAQLQVAAAYPTEAVVRVPAADPVVIKRYLDAGARSLLVPFVEDAEAARAVVAATRYPPEGMRGVSVGHRANRFGRVKGYMQEAPSQLCLVVQLETRRALREVEAIASVGGIDAVFIGPSDLAADLGHLGQAGHPEVQDGIRGAIERCRAVGRPIGILAPVVEDARRYLAWGATMVAVGSDIGVLLRGTDALVGTFAGGGATGAA
jgi:4-hydroxy-2-oxoheptanedioate aldolase